LKSLGQVWMNLKRVKWTFAKNDLHKHC